MALRGKKIGILIESDYYGGIWTTDKHWDPRDPRDRTPIQFPRRESIPDDDVPL